MTSLVSAIPWSSITSSEMIFPFGAAPTCGTALPAAREATKVPCPRPSPAEFSVRPVMVICGIFSWVATSGRDVSTPESTIAIAGVGGAGYHLLSHTCAMPVEYGQSGVSEKLVNPLVYRWEWDVIVRGVVAASRWILRPGIDALTAPIIGNSCR